MIWILTLTYIVGGNPEPLVTHSVVHTSYPTEQACQDAGAKMAKGAGPGTAIIPVCRQAPSSLAPTVGK